MTDLFPSNFMENLLPIDGQLYDLGLLNLPDIPNQSDCYSQLLTELPWQPDIVTLFGKTHITRRQTVWMGDDGLSYRYSGHSRNTTPWHPLVSQLKEKIESHLYKLSTSPDSPLQIDKNLPYFNACLLNYYPSGDEGMGYHADDEKELGETPLIASLSFGATRKMVFKYKNNEHKKMPDNVALYLASGQLIVMAGITQQHWNHCITKTKKVDTGRISLTFRKILD